MNLAHIHLLLNHIPVLGTLFGLLLLVFALLRKSEELQKVTLWAFVLVALSAIPTYLTGEPAEEVIEGLPGVSGAIVERHETMATISLWLVEVLGMISLLGLWLFRGPKNIPQWFTVGVLIFSLIGAGFMAQTANLGGEIRHTEIRGGIFAPTPTDSPPIDRQPQPESGEQEGD